MSKWKQLEEMVKDAGVDTDRLVVVTAGPDTIIGELPAHTHLGGELVDQVVTLKNPKRVITLKMQTPQGIAMNTFISPLELVDGGSVSVKPHMAFAVFHATESSKEQIFGLYANHITEERQNRAMQAGIELAPAGMAATADGLGTRVRLR